MHLFLFSASLHICLLTYEGSTCMMSLPLKMNDLCIHTNTCVYIFFIEACLYDSSVTGPSVHTPHESACLSAPLKWSCLVRQTVKGQGRGLSRNAALCIVCKNKPSGQRYLKRIYIKQLQKQASVCGVVMQQDHTTSLNLIILQDKGIKKSEEKRVDWDRHRLPQNTWSLPQWK